jgi:hypothetical protein
MRSLLTPSKDTTRASAIPAPSRFRSRSSAILAQAAFCTQLLPAPPKFCLGVRAMLGPAPSVPGRDEQAGDDRVSLQRALQPIGVNADSGRSTEPKVTGSNPVGRVSYLGRSCAFAGTLSLTLTAQVRRSEGRERFWLFSGALFGAPRALRLMRRGTGRSSSRPPQRRTTRGASRAPRAGHRHRATADPRPSASSAHRRSTRQAGCPQARAEGAPAPRPRGTLRARTMGAVPPSPPPWPRRERPRDARRGHVVQFARRVPLRHQSHARLARRTTRQAPEATGLPLVAAQPVPRRR